ncbi:MAG TPA: hypothetical protein VG295_09155 [Solirubrobacteraceae bacterium]|jgi:hypothetical protein|nr:hypothetical protein [Solirubrobacteraceae bacterium]
MAIDRTRTLRGAVCGGVAAAVWAAQQPVDKLVFGSRFDDVEILGRGVVEGDDWYLPGLFLHVQNGLIFGAMYANVAPLLPLPPVARGPAVALIENALTWPLGRLTDRLHPARSKLPALTGNRRALAQATWRHLLFGIVLGELERRLNAEPEPAPPAYQAEFSSNGHGSLTHAVSVEPAS